ncbi:hypothetical protein [Eikenella sp. HMSC061C02]|uniref:hypothetical protein n=1 Tax=Eikenella sp. HMSC061C02 TaxID=1715021 RepID=UPI0008A4A22D|nr:hypothetical protein [Eikenella sp. HMSC061C02]OFN60439.1 hypothetical protein HMPREF2541_08050 [Eikenella sp. HMSC061C02]
MLNINHLPAWIRHTDYCPFKALDIDASDMSIPEYFEVMAYLAILSPELRHAINRALRFTKRETLARAKFKAVFESAPAAVKFGFDRKTYQNAESRRAFYQALHRYNENPRPLITICSVQRANHNAGRKLPARNRYIEPVERRTPEARPYRRTSVQQLAAHFAG